MLKDGDKVVMHTCGEAEYYNGKLWTCQGNEFTSSREKVIFLKGFSGHFKTKYLQLVSVNDSVKSIIHERLNYLEKEECIKEHRQVERMTRYDELLILLNKINSFQ